MDPRQQRQSFQQRPAYPQRSESTLAASSVFQSSSSLASLSSINTASAVPQSAHMPTTSAPLPSPSTTNQPMGYFGSITSQTATSHSGQQQRVPQQQQHQQQQPASSPYVGQRGDGGGVPATQPFLQDFGLLAEAAKRAQMACLSRDLSDIGL